MIRAFLICSIVAFAYGCDAPTRGRDDYSTPSSDGGTSGSDAGVDVCAGKVQLKVTANPARVELSESATSTLTIAAEKDGIPVVMNTQVLVTISDGSLAPPGGTPTQNLQVSLENGKAEVVLYAPSEAKEVTITASSNDTCAGASGATTVMDFYRKDGAAKLLFSCRSSNIGVLANTAADFALACDASALDVDNSVVKTANIRFLAEAGTIRKTDDSTGDLPDYIYYPRQGAEPYPKDVAPFTGEPSIQFGDKVRNPRDMLVALVAYVNGDNPQTGDMFAGDPFVDKNDNQLRDDDEPFFSADGSGTYNPAQTSVIWKQVKVVWSGAISTNTSIAKCEVLGGAGSLADLARSGTAGHKSFKYTLLDDYYNVLAANSHSDMIVWDLLPAGMIDFDAGQPATSPLAYNQTGMSIDSKGNFPKATTAATFTVNSTHTLKVYNARSAEDTDGDKQYSVTGNLQRTLTIDETGEPDLFIGDEMLPVCGGILK